MKRKPSPWNKGKQIGKKLTLSRVQIRALRAHLKGSPRELALFNLAIDSGLPTKDLVQLRVRDIARKNQVVADARITSIAMTGTVKFELSSGTQISLAAWIGHLGLKPAHYLFPSRMETSPHLSARQYARLLDSWLSAIGLDPKRYGTHSLRRTRAALIYKDTNDLDAVQRALGHIKKESSTRSLGLTSSSMRHLKE